MGFSRFVSDEAMIWSYVFVTSPIHTHTYKSSSILHTIITFSIQNIYCNQLGSYLSTMLNPSKLEIINCKPIGDLLAPFRDTFRSTCAHWGIPGFVDEVREIDKRVDVYWSRETTLSNLHIAFLNIVSVLFGALKDLPAARLLQSSTGRGTLRKRIFESLGSLDDSDRFDRYRISPLLLAVLNKESDILCWWRRWKCVNSLITGDSDSLYTW